MKLLWVTPALLLAAACASAEGPMPAPVSAQPPTETQASGATTIEGLTIRFFQCDNGEAFTAQNYQNNSVRVTTRNNRYDLRRSGSSYTGDGVTFTRNGNTASLTGADGTYANCAVRS